MTDKAITGEEILKRIFQQAGIDDPSTLPGVDHFVWYPPPGTDKVDALQIRTGQPYPLLASHAVFGIFHDEDEFRVYTIHTGKADPNLDKTAQMLLSAPRCIYFSKKGPTYVVEMLPMDAFITAIAGEWSLVAYDMMPLDRIRSEIAEYIRESAKVEGAAPPSLEELADSIESGEYADEDEEEEEEEDDKPESPPTPPNPASSPGVQ